MALQSGSSVVQAEGELMQRAESFLDRKRLRPSSEEATKQAKRTRLLLDECNHVAARSSFINEADIANTADGNEHHESMDERCDAGGRTDDAHTGGGNGDKDADGPTADVGNGSDGAASAGRDHEEWHEDRE